MILKNLFYNYYTIKLISILLGKEEALYNYYRSFGISIGEGCHIYSRPLTPEPYLIKIGNNVTISTHVTFLTHDNSISKIDSNYSDLFGSIIIGNNTFIGSGVIILPGVKIGDNVIIGSGSVISKSIPSNVVVAGNPARIIQSVSDFYEKIKDNRIKAPSPAEFNSRREVIQKNKDKWLQKQQLK